jgi:hypothetical protein
MPVDLTQFQTTLTSFLTALPELSAVVGSKIYNRVPQGTTYPYLAFKIQSLDPAPDKGSGAYLVTLRLDGFSDYAGDDELLRIQNALFNGLDGKAFADANAEADVIQFLSAAFANGNDGQTHLSSHLFTLYLTPLS